VDTLIQKLKDKDLSVRCAAAWALGKIKDTRAVKPLIAVLKDNVSNVRWSAVVALREIADAAKDWAWRHGYSISTGSGNAPVGWGRW
jgi:HEAT repeat protein